MDTDALTAGLLQELRAAKPYPALSLTMPTHRRAPDNAQDAVRLRNLVSEAGNRLDADPGVTREVRAAVKQQLDRAVAEIDPRRALDALVVLATADDHQIWQLPRTAPERVVLSDTYLTRNLVAAKAQAQPFWALTVSADHATLFSGTSDAAHEEHIGGFPLTAPREAPNPQREERIGDTPSTFSDEETRQFLRTVDEKLRRVLATDPRPLYLVGLAPALALLDEVGESAKGAAGRVTKGAPADTSPSDLLTELRPALEARQKRFAAEIDGKLDEARGRRAFAGGLDEVWAAVREDAPDWWQWRSTTSRRSGSTRSTWCRSAGTPRTRRTRRSVRTSSTSWSRRPWTAAPTSSSSRTNRSRSTAGSRRRCATERWLWSCLFCDTGEVPGRSPERRTHHATRIESEAGTAVRAHQGERPGARRRGGPGGGDRRQDGQQGARPRR